MNKIFTEVIAMTFFAALILLFTFMAMNGIETQSEENQKTVYNHMLMQHCASAPNDPECLARVHADYR